VETVTNKTRVKMADTNGSVETYYLLWTNS